MKQYNRSGCPDSTGQQHIPYVEGRVDSVDNGIFIHAIVPRHRGFESRWSADWQSRYNAILQQADLVRFVCPSYSRDCFQRRNEWMVDRSSRVIAVYNGEPGGTRNTIEYAKAKKVEYISV